MFNFLGYTCFSPAFVVGVMLLFLYSIGTNVRLSWRLYRLRQQVPSAANEEDLRRARTRALRAQPEVWDISSQKGDTKTAAPPRISRPGGS
jgi:hypothetical protein